MHSNYNSQYNSNNYNSKFTAKQNIQNLELINNNSVDSLYKNNIVTNFAKNNNIVINNNIKLSNQNTENFIKSINNTIYNNNKIENNIKNSKSSHVGSFETTANSNNNINPYSFAIKEVNLIFMFFIINRKQKIQPLLKKIL